MRCNLATTEFVSDPTRLSELLYDERLEISSIKPISRKCDVEVDEGYLSDEDTRSIKITTTEKLFMVVYKRKDAFVEEHDTSSVSILR